MGQKADVQVPGKRYLLVHVQPKPTRATSNLPVHPWFRLVCGNICLFGIDEQMFIGDGAKLVRDAFELAKEKAPAIIFIDELDAIGTKRFDSDKAGDREVQRTMLELLNQLDGFSSDSRIKVGLAFPRGAG
jgi:hypothetical protein